MTKAFLAVAAVIAVLLAIRFPEFALWVVVPLAVSVWVYRATRIDNGD